MSVYKVEIFPRNPGPAWMVFKSNCKKETALFLGSYKLKWKSLRTCLTFFFISASSSPSGILDLNNVLNIVRGERSALTLNQNIL